jgi:hypothetical protein
MAVGTRKFLVLRLLSLVQLGFGLPAPCHGVEAPLQFRRVRAIGERLGAGSGCSQIYRHLVHATEMPAIAKRSVRAGQSAIAVTKILFMRIRRPPGTNVELARFSGRRIYCESSKNVERKPDD